MRLGDNVRLAGWDKPRVGVVVGLKNDICYILQDGGQTPVAVQKWKIEVDPIQLSRNELQAMIDLALITNDHEWFEELLYKLKRTKEKSK